ncbi:hypothetical protein QOZ80_8AG0617010 [Eleusine coracana subsp. coracana]|nr:hypothetical protein QOZ80_8AG0617010 [Eleusine coracana subsp. coracana]
MLAALLVVVSLPAGVLVAGDACDQLPAMSWTDACAQSCNNSTPACTKLCEDTLSTAPPGPTAQTIAVFAVAAARQARVRYAATIIDVINPMLGAGNLPKAERLVVDLCKERYVAADALLAAVVDQLVACDDLGNVRQEYVDAQVGIATCQNVLAPYQFLQLYSMVSADYDMTMVAYELGALIVFK